MRRPAPPAAHPRLPGRPTGPGRAPTSLPPTAAQPPVAAPRPKARPTPQPPPRAPGMPIYAELAERWLGAGRTVPGAHDQEWADLVNHPAWPAARRAGAPPRG